MSAPEATAVIAQTCAICGEELNSGEGRLFDTRFGVDAFFGISRCPRCNLEQTVPKPSAAALTQLYESYYNFGGEKGTRYTRFREWFLLSPLYQAWLSIDGDISFHQCKGHGRLLDVGCNEGRGLQIYKAHGYSAEGLEFNTEAANVARAKGFQIHAGDLSDFQPTSPYDVVILSNVLEHALDPGAMIRDIRKILSPKGQLWISCPNNRSWLRHLFGRFWINWHVPFHIVHFSRHTLTALMKKNGFEVLRIRNETPALWFTQSLIARIFAQPQHPTRQLRSILYVLPTMILARCLLFPFFFIANQTGHGDCMVLFAEKREF